jgi:prevent-host-death family protein
MTTSHDLATIVAMTTLPLGDARDRFSALVTSVEKTHDRVTVTRNGVPAAVLISSADLDELEETIAVLSSPDLLRQLGESAADRGRGDALLEAIRSRTDR